MTSTELAAQIEAVIAAQTWPTPSAIKRGRFDKWPFVPVLVYQDGGTRNPIKGNAFETRDEAIAAAARHLDTLKAGISKQLAEPRFRALRKSYGLPEEIGKSN